MASGWSTLSSLVSTFKEKHRFAKNIQDSGCLLFEDFGKLDCMPYSIISTSEDKADLGKHNFD